MPLSLSSSGNNGFHSNLPLYSSQPELDSSGLTAPNFPLKRSSTSGPGLSHISSLTQRQSSLGPSVVKKRASAIGAVSSHGRLYKVLGDFFLLAGRTEEAMMWFVFFFHLPVHRG
jgi:trafficking protein particle complex subunit 9